MTPAEPCSSGGRRWSFSGCIFDEGNWTLTVDGRRVYVEAKPLKILLLLLNRAGTVVSKDELLDAIWPGLTVVEASLPTAVHKLRLALDDGQRAIVETVSGIGYRIATEVKVIDAAASAGQASLSPPRVDSGQTDSRPYVGGARLGRITQSIIGGRLLFIALAAGVAVTGLAAWSNVHRIEPKTSYTQRDVFTALRRLDVNMIEKMLAAGWNPNTPLDSDGNGAIHYVLGICEWDHDHDQGRLLLTVRTLIDGGGSLDRRNVWGDTAYSIAKAPRYCGPNHPVTRSIRTMCYSGYKPRGDRCLASYELARRDHPVTQSANSTAGHPNREER